MRVDYQLLSAQEDRSRQRFIDTVNSLCRDSFDDLGAGSVINWKAACPRRLCKLLKKCRKKLFPLNSHKPKVYPEENAVPKGSSWDLKPMPHQNELPEAPDDVFKDPLSKNPIHHVFVQDYFILRTKRQFDKIQKLAARLARLNGLIQFSSLAVSATATVTSVKGYAQSTVILIALGATLQSLEKHYAISGRLEAANKSIQALYCLKQEWKSFDSIQRNQPANRDKLVEITEKALFEIVSASTAGVSVFQGAVEDKEASTSVQKLARDQRGKERPHVGRRGHTTS